MRMLGILLTAVLALGLDNPADAISLAAQDMAGVMQNEPARARYQRYLWMQEPSKELAGGMALAVNLAANRSKIHHQPAWGGRDTLLRVDLEKLALDSKDLVKLVSEWERLADIDPWFHSKQLVSVPRYKAADGKTYDKALRNEPSLAYNLQEHLLLVTLTGSRAPILRADWFVGVGLSTVNKSPFSPGRYYEFQRYLRKKDLPKHKTEQDAWLELFGANENLIRGLDGDARSIILVSDVTGKMRRADLFYGVASSPTDGPATIGLTHDLKDQNTGTAGKSPIHNLLLDVDDAREGIAADPLQHYALFNNKGDFATEVPPDVATDQTVPGRYTKRLEIIGCIRCHGLGTDRGWKPYQNDLRVMFEKGFDIIDDFTRRNQPDAVRTIARKFKGQPLEPLIQARNNYELEVNAISGMLVAEAHKVIADVYAGYWFENVNAKKMLRMIAGIEADDDKVAVEFEKAFPILGGEDQVIGAYRAELSSVMADAERVAPDLALRFAAEQLRVDGEKIKQKEQEQKEGVVK